MTKPRAKWEPSLWPVQREAEVAIPHPSWATRELRAHCAEVYDLGNESIESFGLEQLPAIITNRLEHSLQLQRLQEQMGELAARLERMEESGSAGPVSAVIQTFAPEAYSLVQPINVTITSDGAGAWVATFYDANISASGDNEQEAFESLKSLILDIFESLMQEKPEALGPEPSRQLMVLRSFISGG